MTDPPYDLPGLIDEIDLRSSGEHAPDTVPTGFASLDLAIGGGVRRQDLIVLGGDVGSGKSALALAMALRTASAGHTVVYLSGEMDRHRVLERLLAIEGRVSVDQMRTNSLSETGRAALGSAALRLHDLPLHIHPLRDGTFASVFEPAWQHDPAPALVVADYMQLIAPPTTRLNQTEDLATTLRAIKSLALERDVACLTIAQLPEHTADREDPRPTLDDFGALGTVKQHADIVLSLYREEMYRADKGVEGAAELVILKNRNGPTGFVDLYFYKEWMRFEDMLDR